jgi:hypothetical protein
MRKIYFFFLVRLLSLKASVLYAQLCGTPSPTPEQMQQAQQQMVEIKARMAKNAHTAADPIIWVPLKLHIVRKSNGTFDAGKEITLASINTAIAYANRKFLPANIQFFILGSGSNNGNDAVDWVNNDALYNAVYDARNYEVEGPLCNTRDVVNALNLYFVPNINGAGGYAYFPDVDVLEYTRNFINVSDANTGQSALMNTLAHELGHNFYLIHTFEEGIGKELAQRNDNCFKAGDLMCDTPADPYDRSLSWYQYPSAVLNNIYYELKDGGVPVTKQGCTLNYVGSQKDSQGTLYTPPLDNIMSYYYAYFFNDKCDHFNFVAGQNARMYFNAQKRANGGITNLSGLPTNQPLPSGLVINRNSTTNLITLNWSDNSTLETGYIIERSTSPTSGFVAVAGVGANVSTYIEGDIPAFYQTIYYYRVKPSNTYDSYSNVATANPLAPSISVSNLPTTTICQTVSFSVDFVANGTYNSGNVFRVQLSDASGNFGASPLQVGSGSVSPITVTLPVQSFAAGTYRLRVVATSPSIISNATATFGIDNVLPAPSITASKTTITAGETVVMMATGCPTGSVVRWSTGYVGDPLTVTPYITTNYMARCENTCVGNSSVVTTITISLPQGTGSLSRIEYFIDNDPGLGLATAASGVSGSNVEVNIPINIASYTGLHFVGVRARDSQNRWSHTHTRPFLVGAGGVASPLTKLEYFYDTDPGYGLATAVSISPTSTNYTANLNLSTTGLSLGLHTLGVRAQTTTGGWSLTHTRPILFLGNGTGSSTTLASAEYFIDTDPGFGSGTQVAFPTGTTSWGDLSIPVNMSAVSEGLHVFYARVKTQTNFWSLTHARPFIKLSAATTQITALEYYFDTDPGVGAGTAIAFSPNPGQDITATVNLNLTGLSAGRHRIFVRAKNNQNQWSSLQNAYFDIIQIPCPQNQTLSSTSYITNGTIQASQQVKATNKVQTGMNLVYKAGNSVLFEPGFEAKSGAVFRAYVSGCN